MLDFGELEGFWWLPTAPDEKVAGTLRFSQDDILLELFGSFGAPDVDPERRRSANESTAKEVTIHPIAFIADQPRILGRTRDGRAITLEDCNGRTVSTGLPGFQTSAYGPHIVLDGAWYGAGEEVAFDEVAVRFSDLDTWACVSGFSTELRWDEQGKSLTFIGVDFTPPEPIKVALNDEVTLKVSFGWTWSGRKPVTTDVRITQEARLSLAFGRPVSINGCLAYVGQLRNFLALAVGRAIRVLSVHGFHNPPADAEPDPFTGLSPHPNAVELLFRLIGVPEPAERELHPVEMLFTLADAKPRLEAIAKAWFDKHELLGPVLVRYFHLIHTTPTSREQEFENLVRVLETHHRRTAPGLGRTSEHEGRLEVVLSSVGDEHRDWLAEKLEFSYEPSLAQRLKDALGRCPTITSRLIGNADARKSFIWRVVATRNFEIHLDRDKEAEAAKGAALVALIHQLRGLVEMTLLLEIGFTCDEIAAIFERLERRYRLTEHLRGIA